MNYEKLGLRLNLDNNGNWSELFGLDDARAEVLYKKVNMAIQIMAIEDDLPKAIAYFLDECSHPNESHYCWFKLGQKCDCSLNGKVSVLVGSSSIDVDGKGPGGILGAILKDILGKDKPGDTKD